MTCTRNVRTTLLKFCLAAGIGGGSASFAVAQAEVGSGPVDGEAVDGDTPTTYRLPVVAGADGADGTGVGSGADAAATSDPSVPVAAALTISPTSSELTAQLLPAVQRGYNLARRGALFAARTEFIQVLRRVAQAKDAAAGCEAHSLQLAAGLRALDEAADFVPRGTQLEGELNVRSVASSHRTPVWKENHQHVLPHEAVAMYHSYAQLQLSQAAANEQAGSMALYGLGKVYAWQAERRDSDVQLIRGALTMYAAALEACPNNNLAANELGVLLCRLGHPAEAVSSFQRAIDIAPTATAYHNLAMAEQKLGRAAQSAANEFESQRLATLERASGTMSRQAGIQWISPAEMASLSQSAPPTASVPPMTAANPANNTLQPRR